MRRERGVWARVDGLAHGVDIRVLIAVQGAMQWVTEWLSVTQAAAERALTAAWWLTATAVVLMSHQAWGWHAWNALVALGLWSQHRDGAEPRTRRMLATDQMWYRLFAICMLLIIAVVAGLAPRHVSDWLQPLDVGLLTVLLYLLALPTGGEPGRRRRAALAKIVDSFGREYVPEGV